MIPRRFPPAFGLVAALALIVLGAVLLAGCADRPQSVVSMVTPASNLSGHATLPATLASGVTVTKVEVVHFHPTRQCSSCTTVGEYANATVGKYFGSDRDPGRVLFREINGELDENRALLKQYGASGSSLWLGVYTSDGGFYAEENLKVWYRIDDRQRYMDYLRGVIEKRLSGDLLPA